MNAFDEAARKAADSVFDWYDDPDEEHRVTPEFAIPILQKKIAVAHADLRATMEKLVELVKLKHQKLILSSAYMTPNTHTEMNASDQGFDLNVKIGVIERDPLVVEAMKKEEPERCVAGTNYCCCKQCLDDREEK